MSFCPEMGTNEHKSCFSFVREDNPVHHIASTKSFLTLAENLSSFSRSSNQIFNSAAHKLIYISNDNNLDKKIESSFIK